MKTPSSQIKVVILMIALALIAAMSGLPACKSTPTSLSPTGPATGILPPPASAPQTTAPPLSIPSPSPSAIAPGSTPAGASPAHSSSTPSRPAASSQPSASAAGIPSTSSNSPLIKIISPKDGSTVANGNITVELEVTNFNLANKIGQANTAGEGHIMYYFDIVPPSVPKAPATAKPNNSIASAGKTNVWNNVPAGSHSFTVQLVNNDNTPLDPPAMTGITVQVQTSKTVNINLVAQNIAFNLTDITVPAGSQVVITFTNMDLGIPHNLDVFQAGGGAKWSIFTGHSITGVSTIVYKFTVPTVAAPYKFQCDFHPLQMYGNFIVTQP
jgi:plastocyanin